MPSEAPASRAVAKFAVKTIVAHYSAAVAADMIIDHTRFEEDDLVVKLGSGGFGVYVATKAKPYTDKMVDKTADKVNSLKEKRNKKKHEKSIAKND